MAMAQPGMTMALSLAWDDATDLRFSVCRLQPLPIPQRERRHVLLLIELAMAG